MYHSVERAIRPAVATRLSSAITSKHVSGRERFSTPWPLELSAVHTERGAVACTGWPIRLASLFQHVIRLARTHAYRAINTVLLTFLASYRGGWYGRGKVVSLVADSNAPTNGSWFRNYRSIDTAPMLFRIRCFGIHLILVPL